MLLQDVQTRVLAQFGDTAQVQVQNSDIARWATDAQLDIVRRTKCNQVTDTVVSIVGQAVYAIANMLDVNVAKYNGVPLRYANRNELDMRYPLRSTPGYYQDTPAYYFAAEGTVEIFPIPVAAGDTIAVTHNRRPIDVVNPGDTFEIPIQYHEDIVRRCLQRAYELDGQWQAADRMQSDYTSRVAATMAETKDKNDDSYPSVRCLPGDMGG